uniref:Histone deacetylase 10 n=1 Tax=Bos taurus TaxID=9913 RepID=Q0V897_BOVIN|nr:histone deacetylase 10 [Bos taurus]
MGTALVYHEDMTATRLLWDDPECEIECPERLTTALERLQQHGLKQRCLQLVAREASEAELGLVHSPEYVALLQGTQALGTRELQALSKVEDAAGGCASLSAVTWQLEVGQGGSIYTVEETLRISPPGACC